jgi:YXWGXW repeat-containing protein
MHRIDLRLATVHLARISILFLLAVTAGVSSAPAQVAVGVSITVAPPLLPVYDQPPIPGPGYIWTPGYWAWDDGDYYWVPGTWVEPPAVDLLWTPGYWGWSDGIYVWNAGYWGPHVGFYGGINYGFGYGGVGYGGGFWRGGVFNYNHTVNNFGGVHITNVYNKTVINNVNVTKVSFNGGTGGTNTKPTQQELAAVNEHHVGQTALQTQHQTSASANKDLRLSSNGGHPAVAATSQAGHFTGAGVMATHTGGPGGEHFPAGGLKGAPGLSSPQGIVGGAPKMPNARLGTVSGAPKVTNSTLGTGPGIHSGGPPGLQPGVHPGSGPSHIGAPAGGGTHIVSPPGGFKGGGGPPPPRVANVPKFNQPQRFVPPRGPAPRGPTPHPATNVQQHH